MQIACQYHPDVRYINKCKCHHDITRKLNTKKNETCFNIKAEVS